MNINIDTGHRYERENECNQAIEKKSSVIKKRLMGSESLEGSTRPNKSVLEDRSMPDKAEHRDRVSQSEHLVNRK